MLIKILCLWGILGLLTGMVMHTIMYGIVNAEAMSSNDLKEIKERFSSEELESFELAIQYPIGIYISSMLTWPLPWYKWGIGSMIKMIVTVMKFLLNF